MTNTLPSSVASPTADSGPPPHQSVWTLANGIVPSACLHAAAELGVADHIGEQPVPVEELASRCGVAADPLDRVLRLLAHHGIFERTAGGYRHTPASRLLREEDSQSMRAFARLMGLPSMWTVFSNLDHCLRTGRPAIETIEPRGFFAYLRDHPDEGRIFGQAMTSKSAAEIPAVLAAYDFAPFDTIADIGGGHGHLIRAVLAAHPHAHGILFDQPEVVEAAEVGDRLTRTPGDFFVDELPDAACYLLAEVLQDWSDDRCRSILRAVRSAARRGAKLLVIENVLDEGGGDPRSLTLDVIFLAVTTGRQRTASELGRLLAEAGFTMTAVHATATPLRIVEATAV